jgi:outer membrane protein assembly factor BamD
MPGSSISPPVFSKMRRTHAFLLIAAAASLIPFGPLFAEVDYQAGVGWTIGDSSQDASEATASAQLNKAQALENSGDYARAMVAYLALTRRFPRSGAAEEAQLKAGDMALKAGDYDHAYALYNEYITRYPKGDQFDQALEGMYNVGQKFLAGARRRVFGVKAFPSMARAQQIFENIVSIAPFSSWAPLAQFYAGQAMERQNRPDDAIAAYQEVIDRDPSDPAAADAQYQIGYVYLTEAHTAYDSSAADKAQEAFEDYLARYPNSEKAPQAQDDLKILQSHENNNVVEIAKFYDKKKDYKAAYIYYTEVIKDEPGTPDAKAAETRIDELRQKLGDAALEPGPEKPETGATAQEARRMQAQVDTASRADYDGPPVAEPTPVPTPAPDQSAPTPALRSSPDDLGPAPADLAPQPAVEPPLPPQ